MTDLLSIGSSALMTYRRALDVVGHNIANVDTEGYSRQRVNLAQRTGTLLQVQNYGEGVAVANVQRLTDRFLFERVLGDDIQLSRLQSLSTFTAEVDGWLSASESGLSKPLQGFFDGLSAVAADPSSTAARTALLGQANTLTSRFGEFQNRFDQMDHELDQRIGDLGSQINDAAGRLAQLNDAIGKATLGGDLQAPNDLLDQREVALRDLANLVGYTTTTTETDGSINLFIGSGQPLVLGNRANTVELHDDAYGRPRDLRIRTGSQLGPSLTNQVSGGELGGVLDFRREVLEPSINELGRIAATLAQAVNEQHAQGVDLYGELGAAFFNMTTPSALAADANTGTGTVAVAIGDATQLTGSEYRLSYDGAAWTLTDTTSGAVIPTTGSGAPGDPLVAQGMELTLSGTAAAGDRFLLQPTRNAAGGIEVAITDAARIAAAAPMSSMANVGNTGSGTITAPVLVDPTDPSLLNTANIAFVDATTYTVDGAGPFTYTPGSPITVNGLQVQIDGAPAAGDSFSLSPTGPDSGDNSNASLLAGIADLKLLDNGRLTLSGANSALVSQVGSQALQFQTQADATEVLQMQTVSQLDSISGVNLDEEAADLTRYEQAYNAAAQVISTARSLFDSLLAAVSR